MSLRKKLPPVFTSWMSSWTSVNDVVLRSLPSCSSWPVE